jgi:hypothetical protein
MMTAQCDIVVIVIPGDLDYRYDRRIDPGFLELFDARGAFRSLTEYARKARYPVDLQFRRNPKTSAQHASLYVGLTTVLDVHWKPGAVRLSAHRNFHSSGFQAAWTPWTVIGKAAAQADAVDAYLDAVIPKASAGGAAVEGAVQAAVSSFDSASRVMLDREVLLHFRDTPTKQRVMDSVTADLLLALETAPVPGARPVSLGGRCDLLAVDSTGLLLAVEVKPKGVPTITWASAQAIVYARLLGLWLRHDPDAAEILAGMIEQRKRLSLVNSQTPVPSSHPGVAPILAVQRGMSQKLRDRLFTVRRHLIDQGVHEATELKVYEVTLAGRLLRQTTPDCALS